MILLIVAVALLLLILLVLYQLVAQQGRILLRLDSIEQSSHVDSHRDLGLGVGSAFPPFTLPALDGRGVSLDDLHGRRVLVVSWSLDCGFCDLIADELAELDEAIRRTGTQLVFVSDGDLEANRAFADEYKLSCPVLLRSSQLDGFRDLGTPAAYLLDESGRVAEPLALGSEQVLELAHSVARQRARLPGERPLTESKILRDGLKAGTPAPDFSLPDIHGEELTLASYRGRKVLLVFSAPDCGPCDALAPELVRFERAHRDNGLAMIMVGRGDPEENRRKAETHGIEFPYVLQQGWKLSKRFGFFATPAGFLIDEKGVVAHDVAQGQDQILTMAADAVASSSKEGNGRAL